VGRWAGWVSQDARRRPPAQSVAAMRLRGPVSRFPLPAGSIHNPGVPFAWRRVRSAEKTENEKSLLSHRAEERSSRGSATTSRFRASQRRTEGGGSGRCR
jgi:hypothetical protein